MEKLSRRVPIARTRFRKKLYAMTDGIAAASPAAVAISASAIPGATVASGALPGCAMPEKAFMTPHTVPNNPMEGHGRQEHDGGRGFDQFEREHGRSSRRETRSTLSRG